MRCVITFTCAQSALSVVWIELYSIAADIGKKDNLANAQPEHAEEMLARLNATTANMANAGFHDVTKAQEGLAIGAGWSSGK